jgi:hypothetical protein
MRYDVNRPPLVAINCATMGMRRYVGRECTHEVVLEGVERSSGREIRDLVDLFREDPARALGRSVPAVITFDQPVPA